MIHQGDCLAVLKTMQDETVDCCITSPRDHKGRFVKGNRSSRDTEFKKGRHWREHKPYWEKKWLYEEYITKGRSFGEIAAEFNITEPAIRFWARKHKISTRTTSEARRLKHWGLSGNQNGMYGKCRDKCPTWKGGITPERQSLYSSREWYEAVKLVWRRDNATCQRCGKLRSSNGCFHIHHIISFAVKELRANPSNLVLLCKECHSFVHSKKNVKGEFLNDVY